MPSKILVVGSLNMDLVVRVSRHPELGETILGERFETFPGGKGANQAVAAARLGGDTIMVGRVGPDAFGAALIDGLQQDHVDVSFIKKDAQIPTGVALITVSADGQNTIVVASGANAELRAEHLPAEAFANCKILLLQLETPLPTVIQAAKMARERGITVILNPAPARPLPAELLPLVDYLIPNQTELSLLANGETRLEQAIARVQEQGVQRVVVTLGSEGALLANGDSLTHLPAYKVNPVDTVAAGDAFLGAFAVALSEDHSPAEAARWGNAAGAIAVTRAGAQPSLPTRAEHEKFLAENPT